MVVVVVVMALVLEVMHSPVGPPVESVRSVRVREY